ncbi:MAG: phosphoribosylaminoimidazolesuccinocarboxamide synthase [Elusimicrobia bacterium]|nr:phosphoribosylaminoimidazolesuccinocarboxamide synthase [Elusimicrobiota bacterium]
MKLVYRGKVRDVYEVDNDKLLIVATDRISCFDFVLPTSIPDKGKILTRISLFWFNYLKNIIKNHLISSNTDIEEFKDRAMLVKKAKRIDIECIVRGYLSGSGWKEYQQNYCCVCGNKLPLGLKESEKLPYPIFTPSTKASDGEHDINIREQEAEKIVGCEIVKIIKEKSIMLYEKASQYALSKGIIIADTKFEFGLVDEKIILIDEVFTPDSSRFWEKEKYSPGLSQESLDKQYVRDYLLSIRWDMKPPVPELSEEVVKKTKEKYLKIERMLCG